MPVRFFEALSAAFPPSGPLTKNFPVFDAVEPGPRPYRPKRGSGGDSVEEQYTTRTTAPYPVFDAADPGPRPYRPRWGRDGEAAPSPFTAPAVPAFEAVDGKRGPYRPCRGADGDVVANQFLARTSGFPAFDPADGRKGPYRPRWGLDGDVVAEQFLALTAGFPWPEPEGPRPGPYRPRWGRDGEAAPSPFTAPQRPTFDAVEPGPRPYRPRWGRDGDAVAEQYTTRTTAPYPVYDPAESFKSANAKRARGDAPDVWYVAPVPPATLLWGFQAEPLPPGLAFKSKRGDSCDALFPPVTAFTRGFPLTRDDDPRRPAALALRPTRDVDPVFPVARFVVAPDPEPWRAARGPARLARQDVEAFVRTLAAYGWDVDPTRSPSVTRLRRPEAPDAYRVAPPPGVQLEWGFEAVAFWAYPRPRARRGEDGLLLSPVALPPSRTGFVVVGRNPNTPVTATDRVAVVVGRGPGLSLKGSQ